MNITVLFNPASGNGRRDSVIERISAALRQDGHRVLPLRVGGPEMDDLAARQSLAASDALLIAGGDGTVNRVLPLAIGTGVPVYHVPLGTENLFARQFGMRDDPEAIRAALGRRRIEAIDTAECNGRPFVIMCSVGPDADVIYRLAGARKGGISHLSYIGPILRESFSGGVSPISLEVDGRVIFENRRGMAVIANGEQYALGANPAAGASLRDGVLDVVFFPAPFKLAVGAWLAASWLGVAGLIPGAIRVRGTHIVVVAPEPGFRVQLDGEAVRGPNQGGREESLEILAMPGSLRVLV